MRKEKVVVRTLPTSKKRRESKQRMKKRKSQKRRKVGLGWARTWVLNPRLWRMVNLCRALGGGTDSFPLGLFLSSLGLSVAPRSGRAHKRMKLYSSSLCWLIEPCQAPGQGHAWALCGQEHGSHIPPKPFSWHFTRFPGGCLRPPGSGYSRPWNRSDLFVLNRAHWVYLGWAFLFCMSSEL